MFGISYSIDPEKNESFIFLDDWDVKQKACVHDVGSGDQTTSLLSGGIWSLDMHSYNPMGTSISARTRWLTAIPRNDPISLANDAHKLPYISRSDGPFHAIFSGNNL